MSASSELVTTDLDSSSHVAVVEFHRPPNNYFDAELISAIADAYERLAATRDCRAVVLCSEGKHFCAGANFSDGVTIGDETRELYRQGLRVIGGPLPVVAAVQGAAVGGGLGLALSADFRVATPSTRFIARFTMIGLHHGFAITETLPRVIGQQRANELLYTGGQIVGANAMNLGLCDRFSDEDDLRATALAFADEIAVAAPLAVAATRTTMRRALVASVVAATDNELRAQERLQLTEDSREARLAARERRRPVFQGR